MDMNAIRFFAMTIGIWVICGVVLFVPLTNLLNYYLGNPQRLSYFKGVLWGVMAGTLFACFQYFHLSLPYVFLISGTIIVGSFVYRKFIKK